MKFISEMTAEEMVPHVFGQNYRTDKDGKPLEQGRGSPVALKAGKHLDSNEQHYKAIGKSEGPARELLARERDGASISDDLREKAAEESASKKSPSKVSREVRI